MRLGAPEKIRHLSKLLQRLRPGAYGAGGGSHGALGVSGLVGAFVFFAVVRSRFLALL